MKKVYVAYMGWEYEGTNEDSIQVFSTEGKAQDYIGKLKEKHKGLRVNYSVDEKIVDDYVVNVHNIEGWRKYLYSIEKLATIISTIPDIKEYQGIYGPPRGGSILAGLLSHELERHDIQLKVLETLSKPKPHFPGTERKPKIKILILDEINDSGGTLQKIKDDWDKYYDLTFATLCTRYSSKFESNYNVYFIDHDDWIVFPYEVVPTDGERTVRY